MKVNGREYSLEGLREEAARWEDDAGWEADIWHFIGDWLNEGEKVRLQTSGSTGSPKVIEMPKDSMRRSAALTQRALGLNPDEDFLLCIPAKYVGGKMMVVRALELGNDIYWTEPASIPELPSENKTVDFTAMVPLQIERLLESNPELIPRFGKIILGGAPISHALENSLKAMDLPVWQTFGMTETASHIALRKLSGSAYSDVFSTLDGVKVSSDEVDRLLINAPHITSEQIVTNDLVEIIDPTHFRWLGRADNVVNSGGIKIIPEEIERTLADHLGFDFFVFGKEDERLGHRLVICVEGERDLKVIVSAFEQIDDKHKRPKEVWIIDSFIRTETGKVKRRESADNVKRRVDL